MAEKQVLGIAQKPEGYKPPTLTQVESYLNHIKNLRQPVIDRIWETKKVRRGEWTEVIAKIPSAYRKMLIDPDLPQVRDFMQRAVGLIAKNRPQVQVMPPSPKDEDVTKAGREELQLTALHQQVEDQQDRDTYAMGIDAQAVWGESWIGVWPDPSRMRIEDYKRGADESAEEYSDRHDRQMADGGVPLVFDDYDPQTVFPFFTDGQRNGITIVETEHLALDIELSYGYEPIRSKAPDQDGKIVDWTLKGHTLSEGFNPDSQSGSSTRVVDVAHDSPTKDSGGPSYANRAVRKLIYVDCWSYQLWLDGILVEEWAHDFGIVPMFPAYGEQTSDRDPGWQSVGIADAAIVVAKQIVMFSAIMAANGVQHGFPTPFLKNPQHGLAQTPNGEPSIRKVAMGEMNLLGINESIEFPFLNAQMGADFGKHLEWLMDQLEGSTLSNFGKAIGSDIAGYAVAQIRSMQQSILSTIYTNAKRQWRKIYYFLRHLVRTLYPGGISLRGPVQEDDETGRPFRATFTYGAKQITDFTLDVEIPEGIPQDEIAQNKNAVEMNQNGIWSKRRTMEKTGVDDPAAELKEIRLEAMRESDGYQQQLMQAAMEYVAERQMALSREEEASPFRQALKRAKEEQMGGPGTFANQGGMPENANGAGPLDQQPDNGIPVGPAVQTQPGGAEGVQQTPAVAGATRA